MKKVSMYTLSTCPWCRKAKKFFNDRKVPFEYTDYDLADEPTQVRIMRELDAEGVKGFPFVRIGDQSVEGYQPDRYAQLLGLQPGTAGT
jgi:glutaredoxin